MQKFHVDVFNMVDATKRTRSIVELAQQMEDWLNATIASRGGTFQTGYQHPINAGAFMAVWTEEVPDWVPPPEWDVKGEQPPTVRDEQVRRWQDRPRRQGTHTP